MSMHVLTVKTAAVLLNQKVLGEGMADHSKLGTPWYAS